MQQLLKIAIRAAIDAGKEILKIYDTDFIVDYKEDSSPLTLADENANKTIMTYLSETKIPVLSEEGTAIPYEERKHWNELWIVDPLDGTKEFVKKNDEFTVNIALIRNQKPVLGVVYAPVLDELYYGSTDVGAFKLDKASHYNNIEKAIPSSVKLPIINNKNYFGIVASRSHLSPETKEYIDSISTTHKNVKMMSKGSSLKICMVAEGIADIYPRFAPTCEWDTAAGHAVVLASGGKIVHAEKQNEELVYNKENILNPWFIVKR